MVRCKEANEARPVFRLLVFLLEYLHGYLLDEFFIIIVLEPGNKTNWELLFGYLALIISHGLDEGFSEQTSQSVEAMTKYLQNKISFQRDIYERNRTFIGKFLNKITFKKYNYIELNGIILASILITLNETAEVDIYKNVIYYFPYEEAEKTVKRLMELDRQAGPS